MKSHPPYINRPVSTPTCKHLPLVINRRPIECDYGSLMSIEFLEALLRDYIVEHDCMVLTRLDQVGLARRELDG